MTAPDGAPTQQASVFFFLPVVVAYLAACAAWYALDRLRPGLWPRPRDEAGPPRPLVELGLAFAATAGLLAMGQVYRAGLLIPSAGPPVARRMAWIANNLLIYTPIFAVLAWRRQSTETIYLSRAKAWLKLGFGCVTGLACVALFLTLRGELAQWPSVLHRAMDGARLASFAAVFLEGVALAFLLVRLRWAWGARIAVVVPAVLFAAAHVPGEIAEGRSLAEMIAFFALNSVLVAAILVVVQRTRDILWLGVVHYLMDVAIRAI